MRKVIRALRASSALLVLTTGNAYAQSDDQSAVADASATDAEAGIDEILVTAQKRSESANRVPLSITAVTADQLVNQGIDQVADLGKVVPGFTYIESAYGTPVFSMRGIGFYETSLAAKPTVSVYVDEVPLPFAVETHGATLDLERVEALKGPQGTLFGESTTGGAINYIAAKPTDDLEGGITLGYGSFGAFDMSSYVSGPLSDTLKARFAVRTEQGGAWQRSYTHGAKLGDRNFTAARLLLDWQPSDRVRLAFSLNGYTDNGDEIAAQYIALTPLGDIATLPYLATAEYAPPDNRAADWTPESEPSRDHRFVQASVRADIDLSDTLTLTSISAYSDYDHDQRIDPDGIVYENFFYRTTGKLQSFSQELRLTGEIGDSVSFIAGANYSYDDTLQMDHQGPYPDQIAPHEVAALFGLPAYDTYLLISDQSFDSRALFGNVDVKLTDSLTLRAGARYTKSEIEYRKGCTRDQDGKLSAIFTTLINGIRGGQGLPLIDPIPQGACVTLNAATLLPEEVNRSLHEDNLSFRGVIDWTPQPGMLVYGSVSRGYKPGSFPILSASDVNQYNPVVQESVLAYEGGIKASLFDRLAQFNASVFYYDYKNKQFRGRVIANPDIFGPLEALVNVPKSSVVGAEVQIDVAPVAGLKASIGATYIKSKLGEGFENYTSYGAFQDFSGEAFPLTPKWQIVGDGEYEFPLGAGGLDGYVGASLKYQSSSYGAFGEIPILKIDAYTIADLRAGVRGDDNRWSVNFFVRNLFDTYYWTNATRIVDTTVRYAGMPRTMGVRTSINF